MVFRKLIRLQVVVQLPINTSSLENSLFCIFYLFFSYANKTNYFFISYIPIKHENFSTLIYSIQMPKTYYFNLITYVKLKFPSFIKYVFSYFYFSKLSYSSIIVNPIAEITVPIACIQIPMSAIILSFFLSTVLSSSFLFRYLIY